MYSVQDSFMEFKKYQPNTRVAIIGLCQPACLGSFTRKSARRSFILPTTGVNFNLRSCIWGSPRPFIRHDLFTNSKSVFTVPAFDLCTARPMRCGRTRTRYSCQTFEEGLPLRPRVSCGLQYITRGTPLGKAMNQHTMAGHAGGSKP